MSQVHANLQRKLSAIEDQELFFEDQDSMSEGQDYEEYLQKQRKEKMRRFKELIEGGEDENSKAQDEDSIQPLTEEMKQELIDDLELEYDQMYRNAKAKPNQYIKLTFMNELQLALIYQDNKPFFAIRKRMLIASKKLSQFFMMIVKHPAFEIFTICVILFNSVMLALDDPTTDVQSPFADAMDFFFLAFYTMEATFKIIGMGFILNTGAYLRDTWNVLDFLVIVTAYIPFLIASNSVNLSSLRAFRVLRPLRTVSSIKSLRTILLALFSSIAQLRDTMIVLMFFYTIFAIAGLQLFSGYLKRRCFDPETGLTLIIDSHYPPYCVEDGDCPGTFICGKQLSNPYYDLISFDTFGWAFLQVFIITTLEGWTDIQAAVTLTFSPYVVFYFIAVVLVGAFFLVNLTLAVIKLNFQPENLRAELAKIKQVDDTFNYWQLRKLDLYQVQRDGVLDTKGYGVTREQMQLEVPKRGFQRKQTRRQTTQPNVNGQQTKRRVQFAPIKTAIYFSDSVKINSLIRIQGIFGMGCINKASNQRVSLLRKNSESSDQNSSRKVDNLVSEVESNIKSQQRVHRKSVMTGFTPSLLGQHSSNQEGTSDVQNSPHPDNIPIEGFKRVEGAQRTLVAQHRGSVESRSSNDSKQPVTPSNHLDVPGGGAATTTHHQAENFRQLSFNIKPQAKFGVTLNKKSLTKPPKSSPKGTDESKNEPTLPEDELDSVNLSELNTISDDELDARLEEMDIFIEDRERPQTVDRVAQLREKARIRRIEQQRQRDAQLKAEQEVKLDEASIQLKADLFQRRFYPIVDTANVRFLSENDVLANKLLREQQKQQQEYQARIRAMKVRMTYNFRNQRTTLDFKKSTSKSSVKNTSNYMRQKSSKDRGPNKKGKSSNIRRVKPLMDDHGPNPDLDEEQQQEEQEDQQQQDEQDQQQQEHEEEETQNQKQSGSQKLGQSQHHEDGLDSQRFRRLMKKREERTYETYKAGFKVGEDSIVDLARLYLVQREPKSEKDVEKEKKEKEKEKEKENKNHGEPKKDEQEQENLDEDKMQAVDNEAEEEDENEIKLDADELELRCGVFYQEYEAIKRRDIEESEGKLHTQASIEEILLISDYRYYEQAFIKMMNSISRALNYTDDDRFIWLAGPIGLLLMMQRKLLRFTESWIFEFAMNMAVAINTIILSLDGLLPESSEDTMNQFNFAFTIIFTVELGVKVLGQGLVEYIRDTMNRFDAVIVALSLVELFFLGGSGKSSLSAFRSVRIFRAFRVLRVTKLMRSLKFMGFLISVLSRAVQSFMYILLLLIIFIFIFVLLGMAFFGGQLSKTPSRQNYDDIQSSFLVVFQVLTLENWNSILYDLLRQDVFPLITILYLVSWIMIGNYVFLNLFMAILLEFFEEQYKKDKADLDTNIEIGKDSVMETTTNVNTLSAAKSASRSKRSLNMDQEEIKKKRKLKEQTFEYFTEPNICQFSLNIFSQTNLVRRICYRIVKDSRFETLIFIMIFLTSIKLVFDTYIGDEELTMKEVSLDIDIFFAAFFLLEMLMKLIAFGFFMEPASYLRESWNILDFFIVCASLVDISVTTINLSFVKILRLLRTLRPLRFITHNRSMKILVSALLQSINGIFNVAIVVILIWVMFAILGINLMKGKLHYCKTGEDEVYYHVTAEQCPEDPYNGVWDNHKTNFDNIYNGLLTLFILTTLEGWPDIMYYFIDADESGPIKGAQLQFSWFIIIFILFGSILLMNLFVGVILVNYHIAEEASRDSGLTQHQVDWIEVQKLIAASNPNMAQHFPPDNPIRALFFYLTKHPVFEGSIMTLIVGNIIIMALSIENAESQYDEVLNNINLSFTCVFIAEAVFKLIALGPVGYFRNSWNQFDFFVVMASILDIVLEFSGTSFISFLKAGPQLARVFRVLRVTRLFRLVKQFEGLQKLIETAIYSIPAMLNVSALLFLVYFIFAILGVFLFKDVRAGEVIDKENNFQDFHHAFLLLFRSSTGENWFLVMFDTMADGNGYYCVFWIIFILIQQYIMLNLFVLIVLDQYEINYFNTDNPLNRFQENENIFVEAWAKHAKVDKGLKMYDKYLVRLMLDMEKPLGYEEKTFVEEKLKVWKRINYSIATEENIQKMEIQLRAQCKKAVSTLIMKMNIFSDQQGLVRYHQILFAFMKSYMWPKVKLNLTEDQLERITQKEEETQKKLRRKVGASGKDVNSVNPIVQRLFVSMSFKALQRYGYKKKIKREQFAALPQKPIEHYSEDNSSNSSFDRNVEINSRKSADSEHPARPDYGRTKYLALPNTEVYKDDMCLYNMESPHDGASDQSSSAEDTTRQMQQYRQNFKQYLVDNQDPAENRDRSRGSRSSQANTKPLVENTNSRTKIRLSSQQQITNFGLGENQTKPRQTSVVQSNKSLD